MNEVHQTTERFLFEDLQGKKLEVDFDGGLLFLREVERRLRLLDRIAKVLHDRHHPGYTRHSLLESV